MNSLNISSFFQHYCLLDENFADQVEKISGFFGSCSKNFIFEIPLDGNEPKVDFSLSIRRQNLLQLLDYWEKKELKSLMQNESWKKIIKFFIEWRDPNSSIHKISIVIIKFLFRDLYSCFDFQRFILRLVNPLFQLYSLLCQRQEIYGNWMY